MRRHVDNRVDIRLQKDELTARPKVQYTYEWDAGKVPENHQETPPVQQMNQPLAAGVTKYILLVKHVPRLRNAFLSFSTIKMLS